MFTGKGKKLRPDTEIIKWDFGEHYFISSSDIPVPKLGLIGEDLNIAESTREELIQLWNSFYFVGFRKKSFICVRKRVKGNTTWGEEGKIVI